MPEFFRHALTMFTGSVIAQVIPFAVSPILTRLYRPEDFGIYSTVLALAGILSVATAFRFELSVVLPQRDEDAAILVRLALVISLATTLVFLIGLPFVQGFLVDSHRMKGIGAWIYVVPLLACLIALQQVASFFANRFTAYRDIALSNVAQQGSTAAVAILSGIGRLAANGLIVSRIAGLLVGIAVIAGRLRGRLPLLTAKVTLNKMREHARSYRQFPLFNVPYSFVGVFSKEFLILAFTAVGQLETAGFYGLARVVLTAPINFLTSSMSQVFYREAALNVDTEVFRNLVYRVMKFLAISLVPLFSLALGWADQIFSFAFGAQWRQAGVFAAYLIPLAVLSLFTSWPERIFEVRRRQSWALGIQVVFDVSSVILVFTLLHEALTPEKVLCGYVAVQIGYHLTYLAVVFRLIGLSKRKYIELLSICIGLGTLILFTHAMLDRFSSPMILRLGMETALAVGITCAGIVFHRRKGDFVL